MKSADKKNADKKIFVRQTRSTVGREAHDLRTLRSLGLGRIGKSAVHVPAPAVLGMLKRVSHLIEIEELPAAGSKTK